MNVAVGCRVPNERIRGFRGRGGIGPTRSDEISRRPELEGYSTYDDNFDCDECDNDELHTSAGCLGEWVSSSCKVLHGRNSSPHGEVAEVQIAPQPHTLSCHLPHASGP